MQDESGVGCFVSGAVSIPLLVTTLVGNSSVVSAASVATMERQFAGKATGIVRIIAR
jgi:hypothetical protein